MRGTPDILLDTVRVLRDHAPLVAMLPSRSAIYPARVTADHGHDVEVTVSPVFEGSTPHRGVMEREYRIQVTVKATYGWREARDSDPGTAGGMSAMQEILMHVADRMDRLRGFRSGEVPLGSEGGPEPIEMDDGRLAVIGDWRVRGWYIDDG